MLIVLNLISVHFLEYDGKVYWLQRKEQYIFRINNKMRIESMDQSSSSCLDESDILDYKNFQSAKNYVGWEAW